MMKKLTILSVFVMLFSITSMQAQTTPSSNNLLAELRIGTGVEGDLYDFTQPVLITFDPYVNYYRWILTDPIFGSQIYTNLIAQPQDSTATVDIIPTPPAPANPYLYTILVTAEDGSENSYYLYGVYAIGQTELEVGSMSIYPNPSTGVVNIEVTEEITEYSIEVLSVTGQNVFFSEYKNTNTQASVDLSAIADGMYFVILRDKQSGKFSKEKISILK